MRLSLRAMLLVVAVGGLLMAVLGPHIRQYGVESAAVRALQKQGATVSWSFDGSVDAVFLTGARIDAEDLEPLRRLSGLRSLHLGATPISDDAIETLESLERLEFLSVSGTRISDQGLERLRKALPNTEISAVGMQSKGAMPKGERLVR